MFNFDQYESIFDLYNFNDFNGIFSALTFITIQLSIGSSIKPISTLTYWIISILSIDW